MYFLLKLFLVIILIELIIRFGVKIFKSDFQWLITKDSYYPKFNEKKLEKFYLNTFDKYCGWDRKPKSSGYEILKNGQKNKFVISPDGYRGAPRSSYAKISVFGDSFAFCRYVSDNQTWESFLEKKIKSQVLNYGVGNFGIDQSYFKYKKYEKKINSKIIIVNVVPETITRIVSGWRHFSEFGNIYSFKPYFELKKEKIIYKKNPIKKNYKIKKINMVISLLMKKDFMFNYRFKKNVFENFFIITLIKNFNKYIKVFSILFIFKILKFFGSKSSDYFYSRSLGVIINSNIKESHKLYNNNYCSKLLKKIIQKFQADVEKKGKIFILAISPQIYDIKEKKTAIIYKNFFKQLKKNINILDLSENMPDNFKDLYFNDKYGGHLNNKGNLYISKEISKYLKDRKFL